MHTDIIDVSFSNNITVTCFSNHKMRNLRVWEKKGLIVLCKTHSFHFEYVYYFYFMPTECPIQEIQSLS